MSRVSYLAGRRSGFALALALGALVIIGALVAGLLFAIGQEQRAARNALAEERAFARAELMIAEVPALWRGSGLAALAVGATERRAVALSGGDSVIVRLTRATARTAWAAAEAQSGVGPGRARRVVAMLFRLAGDAPDSTRLVPVTQRAWMQTY